MSIMISIAASYPFLAAAVKMTDNSDPHGCKQRAQPLNSCSLSTAVKQSV
jgi:hypothetical protein